jgi:hypothetical protein
MTIYLLNGKPHIAVSNGYQPISDYEYYMMLEQSEVDNVEEVYHD